MRQSVLNLEPQALWSYFCQLNAIPRATCKEKNAANFILQVAAAKGLKTIQDNAGNVLVLKPASEGMESYAPVALQAHLDMVHQKNAATVFDFDRQGIEMVVDGDWVKANGTTLGADNGIGVAAMLAILNSEELPHPPLQALFTVGEEKGMTGAMKLQPDLLTAPTMLNLDTEEEGTLTIGCAGRVAIHAEACYTEIPPPTYGLAFEITISGLAGGHSGLDIHLGHGNAIKLLCKLLTAVSRQSEVWISSISGGGLHNAIPREAKATVVVSDVYEFLEAVELQAENMKRVFHTKDPAKSFSCLPVALPSGVMDKQSQKTLLHIINWLPDGLYALCSEIPGLVQTSNNLAVLELDNGKYALQCLTRSSLEVEKEKLAQAIERALTAAGASVKLTGSYSGWISNPDSPLVRHVAETYFRLFNKQPTITAIHAGLECGIIKGKYPDMEIVSLGPTILGAHSPEERVQISSVQRFWQLLLAVLAQPRYTLHPDKTDTSLLNAIKQV